MAVLLEDLYENTKQQYHLSLIAGADGLTNIVNWVYVAEDIGNAGFLKGDELIISTGFSAPHKTDWLETLIHMLIKEKTSGLILNIGKYISAADITPEVTALCDRHAFPLFTMPWETYISDLSQDFCNRIFEDRQSEYDLTSALKAVLRDETISPSAQETLTSRLYLPEDDYTLAVLELPAENTAMPVPVLRRRAAFCPSARKTDFVSFDYHKNLVLVWHNADAATVRAHLDELLAYCATVPQLQNIHAGATRAKNGLETLKKQYAQAYAALVMAKTSHCPWFSFEDMGCYQILFAVSDHEILKNYYRRYIGALEDYDKAHGGNYLKTLEAYLRCDRHLARTAEVLICHRNTVNYRINKIRELFGVDFNDGDVKFHLQLALNIRNYLEIFAQKSQDAMAITPRLLPRQ